MRNKINVALMASTLTTTFTISNIATASQNVESDYRISFSNHM